MTNTSTVPLRVLAGAAIVAVLWWGGGLLAPLCLAIFVALALNPFVTGLSRWMPRAAASAVLMVALVASTVTAGYYLSDNAVRAAAELPGVARELRVTIQKSAGDRRGLLYNLDRAIGEVQRLWRRAPDESTSPPDLRRELLDFGVQGMVASTQAVAIAFLVYFLLATGDSLKLKVVRLAGDRLSQRKITVQVIDQLTSQVGMFVVYLAFTSSLVGLATWAAFAWLGMPYASLWGLAAALMNTIPYLGPTFVMIASAVAALVHFQSFGMALAVSGSSLAITSIEGMMISTVLFGRLGRIHPVAVFLSLVFWGWLWGPIGAFLAVPIVNALKTVADLWPDGARAAELLGDGSAPSALARARTGPEPHPVRQ